MLFVDIFLYLILAWYVTQVVPSPTGISKPWYFVFLPSYWCSSSSTKRLTLLYEPKNKVSHADPEADLAGYPKEKVDETLAGRPTISVSNMTKSFGKSIAVDNLSFDMYENQIFVLLGHNGAGKTTAINMLTGVNTPGNCLHCSTLYPRLWLSLFLFLFLLLLLFFFRPRNRYQDRDIRARRQ